MLYDKVYTEDAYAELNMVRDFVKAVDDLFNKCGFKRVYSGGGDEYYCFFGGRITGFIYEFLKAERINIEVDFDKSCVRVFLGKSQNCLDEAFEALKVNGFTLLHDKKYELSHEFLKKPETPVHDAIVLKEKEKFLKVYAEKAKDAADKTDFLNLPTLTGTDKQVAWANTIRIEKIKNIENLLQKKWKVAAKNAKFWIDNKSKSTTEIEELAFKK